VQMEILRILGFGPCPWIRGGFSPAFQASSDKLAVMNLRLIRFLTVIFTPAVASASELVDVVIYGGTSAGVTAAVQCARMGKSVVVIEPGKHIGGLTSAGLGLTDSGIKEGIGGLSRDFYRRVKQHYASPTAWKQEKAEQFKWFGESTDALWRFEPGVAENILREMLAEHNVRVVFGQRLDLKKGVVKSGAVISEIRMESGESYPGKRFIDATYEGDLMALAGVKFHVGREANSQYGETLNGVQTKQATKHQFLFDLDPYVKPGDPTSGLLPGIQKEGPGAEDGADRRMQAYCFRLCMTDDPNNMTPWPKPDGYDPMRYELGLRYALAGNKVWHAPDRMPNRKTDTNNNGGFSTDNIGMNYDYPEGDYATREKIIQEHETYQKGFYWFFANDPRVPEAVKKEFRRWGLAKDEFVATGNWPHQLYIREARRMIGAYVHTEHDCRRTRPTPQSAGLGSYAMDSHNVQRYVDAKGHVRNEGDVQVKPGGAYQISYLSLCPKKEECTNLLVPVCLSSSHIAYGSIRMEPVFMILGQSATTAAIMAIDAKIPVQEVPYEKLSERLKADGQILEYTRPAGAATKPPSIKLDGILIDDTTAQKLGDIKQHPTNRRRLHPRRQRRQRRKDSHLDHPHRKTRHLRTPLPLPAQPQPSHQRPHQHRRSQPQHKRPRKRTAQRRQRPSRHLRVQNDRQAGHHHQHKRHRRLRCRRWSAVAGQIKQELPANEALLPIHPHRAAHRRCLLGRI
jgi:hypothetical protein